MTTTHSTRRQAWPARRPDLFSMNKAAEVVAIQLQNIAACAAAYGRGELDQFARARWLGAYAIRSAHRLGHEYGQFVRALCYCAWMHGESPIADERNQWKQ